ncbi:hypothetical protein J3E07_001657 [Methanococcus voltae]|uniref:Uncharacterized protein n=1 Tax=Methanococcus voltae TaxID=2188 RepID=A0A8J7UVA7_METVO|nr:hypothetical protein [Methanococcus voltae]MBP2202216.1 hypothetical protein [Methanococcus voltae]
MVELNDLKDIINKSKEIKNVKEIKTKHSTAFYFANSTEIPDPILEKYYAFLNKDSTTSNLTSNQIKSLLFQLRTKVYLDMISHPHLRNELSSILQDVCTLFELRANKSLNGMLLKKSLDETNNQNIDQKQQLKQKWGLF